MIKSATQLERRESTPSIPLPQQPAETQSVTSRACQAALRYFFVPAKVGAGEVVQGTADRLSEILTENRQEITNVVHDLFADLLFRRCPENYSQLLQLIRTFLTNPSRDGLFAIKQLLNQMSATQIKALAPNISEENVRILSTLRDLLDNEVTLIPSSTNKQSPHVKITDTVRDTLNIAAEILDSIIKNYEGVAIQLSNFLTQGINDEHGPGHALRQQFTSLRHDLNARVRPPLRKTKEALDVYRNALKRNATSSELVPLIQNLRENIRTLKEAYDLVPQITSEQWQKLEEFDRGLQQMLEHQDMVLLPRERLQHTDAAFQIIAAGFTAQHGIIEEATDILVEGVERSATSLEALPGRMYQNFFSPHPPSQDLVPKETTIRSSTQPRATTNEVTPATVGSPADFANLNGVATRGKRLLDSILSSAESALSEQAASSLAQLVISIFENIRSHIDRNPEQLHLLETINPMIQRLQGAIQRKSWGELTGVLQDAFQFMQAQQVYLQGLRLPINPVGNHVSAIPDFIQNINAHQNILQPPSQRTPQKISDKEFQQKSKLFKSKFSSIGPAKLVLEKVCGVNASDGLYAEIYKTSDPSDEDISSIFRQRLFEKIDQADLGFFSMVIKWSAKRIYDLLVPFSSFYVSAIFDNVLHEINSGITSSPSSPEFKEELFIKLIRNWLAVTSGAYNQVAAVPSPQAKDFDRMMEEAIKAPERNGGLKPHELFAAFANTMIDSFGPKIQWNKTIDLYFKTQIPSHSLLRFLNPLVLSLNYFCSFTLKAMLFIPQWLGNYILQSGAKIALGRTPFLQNYAEQTIDSLRRNTPTSYAMQCLLYRQLQKILQLLQQNLRDDTDEATNLRNRDTNVRTTEITGLVEYLMETLNKSQYHTQDNLKKYLKNQAPLRDRASRELDDTFIPEVMETIVMTISTALKAVTQEEEMQQMLYDAMCIANDSIDDKQPVSDAAFAAIEKGIQELTDQILETAIFHAIDEKLDFTNEKQKRGMTNFIRTMKEQSQTFVNQIQQGVQKISQDCISTPDLVSQISALIEHSCQYHQERVDALGRADGNHNFHTETKHYLNQLSSQLLSYCNPCVDHLNCMKNIADEIAFDDGLSSLLSENFKINQTLSEALKNQNLSFCQTQLASLQQNLASLQRIQCPSPLIDQIQQFCHGLSFSLQKMEQLKKTQAILESASPLFLQLKREKLRVEGNSSSTLQSFEQQLCALLNTLPSPEEKKQLNQRILALMLAQNKTAIEATASQFLMQHLQCQSKNSQEENAELSDLRKNQTSLQSQLQSDIEKFSSQIRLDRSAIRYHRSELTDRIRELDDWVQAQHELPIWNLFIFDMHWVTETLKNLAFDRAQTKMKQLFESLYQRHNYLGFINQVLILPFLEKFGKHHLR